MSGDACRIEGRAAYLDGKLLCDNPYRFGGVWDRERAAQWQEGYLEAMAGNFTGTRLDGG